MGGDVTPRGNSMTDNKLPATASPPAAPKIGARVKAAIDCMVWEALPRKEAAERAGLREHSLYKALRRAPVLAYLRSEMEVLRLSGRSRNFHRLEEIRDQDSNPMAAVAAIRQLEQSAAEQDTPGNRVRVPGIVIQIINAPAEKTPPGSPPTLTIEHDVGGDVGTVDDDAPNENEN
jgi:hypothetical protein